MSRTRVLICPYCGETQPAENGQCRACRGYFEPLSRQATQNAMGPWFIHDPRRCHHPGFSYETLAKMIERGEVTKYTILRGPTSRQFWTIARHLPGVAHLLGYCHACDARVEPSATGCPQCGVPFGAYLDRNHLGLSEIRSLPGEAPEVSHPAPAGEVALPTCDRISSFAADEELLAAAGAGGPARGGPLPAPQAAADPLHSPVVRSMQRRIARQQRTIRTLIILVFAIALVGAAFNVIAVTALRGTGAGPPAPARPPSGSEAAADPVAAPPPGSAGDSRAGRATPPENSGPVAAPGPAPAAGAGTDGRGGEDPAAPAWEEAVALSESAADATRPRGDRLRDYERALELLRGLAAGGDAAAPRRASAQKMIARMEDAVERLRLKDFFR